MPELPTGTVTFLFTDIEGSTRLLQALGRDAYAPLQDAHATIVRQAIRAGDGTEIRTVGDGFFAVFPTAGGAIRAAVGAQRDLASHPWPDGCEIRVRMGLHSGEASRGGDDYLGLDVNRAARIAAAGHGGQVLLSGVTKELAGALPDGVAVRELGRHRLKDLEAPELLHDLVGDGLPDGFPPIVTVDDRRTNLPSQRTSFVGRTRELAEVATLVDAERLVTLTGPGGTGKTRLALRVANGLLDRFPGGVWFVDLSAVTDPALLIPTISAGLGVREAPGRPLAELLTERLSGREQFLVLDNLEQLVSGADAIGRLVDAAPELRILATSRIPLRLAGEAEYPVDPMGAPVPGAEVDADGLLRYEAVALFAERATRASPGFALTDDTAPAVAEIAAKLEGLPLALELAASRLRVLTPQALAARLDRDLLNLSAGPRDVPERQRSMEAAIRSSFDLLEEPERRLFVRLAVFSGGWSLEAAEAVAAGDDQDDVIDGLGSLVEASLVRRDEGAGGAPRFRMLEPIRAFAAARLEGYADRDEVVRRHAAYFLTFAEEAGANTVGAEQLRWLIALDRDHDNLRAAMDHAEATSDPALGLRIAAGIWRFWQLRGHLTEGRERIARLLTLPGADRRDAVRARALGALGGLAYWQADYEPVREAYAEAVEIARAIGDRVLLASALLDLAFVPLAVDGDPPGGMRLLDDALTTVPDDAPELRALILTSTSYARFATGDMAGAEEAAREGIGFLRGLGDRVFLSEAILGLCLIAFLTGRTDEARAHLRDAAEVALGSETILPLLAYVVLPHAVMANHDGDHERAAKLVGAGARIEEDLAVTFPSAALLGIGDPERMAREALGDEAFERAWSEGYALDDGEVADLLSGPAAAE